MSKLSNLEPKEVFYYFEEITKIPHGSRNVEAISNYLVTFAKEHGLKFRQDEAYNVIIWKDGSAGYEASEPVIIQGHMDMVAVKEAGCQKDMEKEGLDLVIDGDYLSADGTSLGGDDGIAVAYALAVLASDTIEHPPIEAVFTVDEEIGMLGAAAMDTSDLKGHLFLNIDSEDEGIFTVSCAGGASATCLIPYEKEQVQGALIDLRLDGFCGGHSGAEIHKGRLNANVVLGRILAATMPVASIQLIDVHGGEKDNAIATFSGGSFLVDCNLAKPVMDAIQKEFSNIQEEYHTVDPQIALHMENKGMERMEVMTDASTKAVITALMSLPNGIIRMNPNMEHMVQTSLNLGVLATEASGVKATYSVRSSSETEKMALLRKLTVITEHLGGSVSTVGDYPGWEYLEHSKVREVMVEAYKKQYGEEPIVSGIHAGLECGLFASKIKDLDAISFGPQMHDIHTTKEVLSISSTERTWKLLLETLKNLK